MPTKSPETRGLDERYHAEGCPDTRTERFQREEPKGLFEIVRCIDCGGQKITKLRGRIDS